MRLLPRCAATAFLNDIPVSSDLPFMPESQTPLAFTPMLARMTPEQRLSYNRLHALFFHEQIIFFEQRLARPALETLARDPDFPSELSDGLSTFIREECDHSAIFSELLRRADPVGYAEDRFRFVRIPPGAGVALDAVARRPKIFPMIVMMLMMQEERSLHHGAAVLRDAPSLDPAFVAAHRLHLADEVGHVYWDEALLERILPTMPEPLRRANLTMLARLTDAFFIVPRRGSLRVIDALTLQHPELLPRRDELKTALKNLRYNRSWRLASQSREVTPKTFAWFDRFPEIPAIRRAFPGYSPLPT